MIDHSTPITPKRRAIPAQPAPPPDSELLDSSTLLHGDDPAAYNNLRAKTHRLAANLSPRAEQGASSDDDYDAFLADVLAHTSWQFARTAHIRAAALNLQIADDYERLDREFETLTPALRQYLAWKKITPEQGFQTLLRDTDRQFRSIHQTRNGILRPGSKVR